jgi:opacity protein-like surface antigen
MKKLLGLFSLVLLASLPTMAQFADSPRVEVEGGYAFRSFEVPFSPRLNENGWSAGAAFNVTGWLGLAADFDGTYGTTGGISVHNFTYLFGPRVYPMGHHRITPFVHALFGESHISIPAIPTTDNAFGWEAGGGVDASVTNHIAVRVGEFDFEQTRNFDAGSMGNPNQNNFKFKAGVVVRF